MYVLYAIDDKSVWIGRMAVIDHRKSVWCNETMMSIEFVKLFEFFKSLIDTFIGLKLKKVQGMSKKENYN